jgi:hypothetical protein
MKGESGCAPIELGPSQSPVVPYENGSVAQPPRVGFQKVGEVSFHASHLDRLLKMA